MLCFVILIRGGKQIIQSIGSHFLNLCLDCGSDMVVAKWGFVSCQCIKLSCGNIYQYLFQQCGFHLEIVMDLDLKTTGETLI